MPNQQKRMCENCEFWESINDGSDENIDGTCHYWPPARSKEIKSVKTEVVDNPEIRELMMRLAATKLAHAELEAQSKRIFQEYPVKRTYGEVQGARSKVEESLLNIGLLNTRLEQEKTGNSKVIKETHHTQERGVWPVTASDDWCGQWRENDRVRTQ